jgi:hypothetical protein
MAWPGETARGFVVSVEAGAPARGTITVTNEQGTEGMRALEAATCEDVVDGLALILALAVDPKARTVATGAGAQPKVPLAEAPPPPLASAQPPASPPLVAPQQTPARPSAAPIPVSRAPDAPDREVAGPLPLARRFFVGAELALATGVAPSALFAAAPYIGVRALRAPIVDVSVRASFVRADSGSTSVLNGQADFTWTVGRLDGCALFQVGGRLGIGPCARVEAGALDVVGSGAGVTSQTQDTGWFAAGGTVGIEWPVFGALLLEGDAGVMGRFIQDSFYFRPDRADAYHVAAAGFDAALGIGALFP